MNITETLTGKPVDVIVSVLEKENFKKLNKNRYFFNWNKYKEGYLVYKLTKVHDDDILGVMAVLDVPPEFRFEIALICCSKENYSSGKLFDGIAGCMIGFICRDALKKYGELAAVSLLPKTQIRNHYKNKYGMEEGGKQLFLFGEGIISLIKKYL